MITLMILCVAILQGVTLYALYDMTKMLERIEEKS